MLADWISLIPYEPRFVDSVGSCSGVLSPLDPTVFPHPPLQASPSSA